MPNIKSAIKRVSVNEKKNLQNRMIKSKIATMIKKFETAVENKEVEEAKKLFSEVVALLDGAAKDNVIHKNSASRKQSRLAVKLATITK